MTTRPEDLGQSFARLMPRGPTLLIIGVLAGLAFPALAQGVRPLMTVAIFVLVLGTFLQVDGAAFRRALLRPRVWLLLPALAMVVCPLAVGFAARGAGFAPELIVALLLSVCAPPSSGTAAVARMLGFDATVPLAVTLLSMALAPVTVPLIAAADGTPLSGEALLAAMVALQDLDRMAQTAGALSAFAAEVAAQANVGR